MTIRKNVTGAALLFAAIAVFCAARVPAEAAERSGFFFDTTVDIRVNGGKEEELLDRCFELCAGMELVFSAENENSELYAVNHRTSQNVTVSDDFRDCLERALEFCRLTDGRFDVTIYPVSSLWDFHTADPAVPDAEEIAAALEKVDYTRIRLDGSVLSFDSEDIMIDLGGIAKGYISAKLCRLLRENGCTSALINLGGNVSTVGSKKKGKPWKIGIQKPFAGRGETIYTVDAQDRCVITSGIYERCFEQDGILYHHIIDPKTGYPSDSGLWQVTVIGNDDAACDALATCAILSGIDGMEQLISYAGIDAEILWVGEDGVLRNLEGDAA